jgi:hypothetical protein
MRTETGDKIVDWYMAIALDSRLPQSVRNDARRKLTDFALRHPDETVESVDGRTN